MRTVKHALIAVALLLSPVLYAQQHKNVLFVGNSYTDVNNLPQLIASVALSMGDTLSYSSNTPGGCTFMQHCNNQSMTLIQMGGWDAVVLQEQSQYPSFPQSQVETEVFPYAKRLVDSVYAHGWCTEPMFYMTWGRRNGDAYNAQFFPPLGTYEGMDSLLYERYLQMASDNDASVCPVGRVWRYLRTNHPEIELYQSDESHPSMAGSYAAACAFYSMLFLRDPGSISYTATLQPDVAAIIRQAVQTVVFDTLPKWQRTKPIMQTTWSDTMQYMNCSFDVQCDYCDTVACDWGDGTTTYYGSEQSFSASHLYADTGLYTITLSARRHCMETSLQFQFHAETEPTNPPDPPDPPESIEQSAEQSVLMAPNPASSMVRLSLPSGAKTIELYDLQGRLRMACIPHSTCCELEVSLLPAGSYLLRVQTTQGTITRKLQIAR